MVLGAMQVKWEQVQSKSGQSKTSTSSLSTFPEKPGVGLAPLVLVLPFAAGSQSAPSSRGTIPRAATSSQHGITPSDQTRFL